MLQLLILSHLYNFKFQPIFLQFSSLMHFLDFMFMILFLSYINQLLIMLLTKRLNNFSIFLQISNDFHLIKVLSILIIMLPKLIKQ